MFTRILATSLFFIVIIGSAIALIGGSSGIARAMVAGNAESAHHASVLADGPGSGIGDDGFTWG